MRLFDILIPPPITSLLALLLFEVFIVATEQLLLTTSASYDYALYIIALLMSFIYYIGGFTLIELELVGALIGLSYD